LETNTYTDPLSRVDELSVESALGKRKGNGRGSVIQGIRQKSAGVGRLQLEDWRRRAPRGERDHDRGCGRDNYMSRCAQSATGVRHVCRRMEVRNLNRRAEHQQQGTAKSEGYPPRASYLVFGRLIVHQYNYNVAAERQVESSPAWRQKANHTGQNAGTKVT
jgi:hypothetical protein